MSTNSSLTTQDVLSQLDLPIPPSNWCDFATEQKDLLVFKHHVWRATSLTGGCTPDSCVRCAKEIDVVLQWFRNPKLDHPFLLATAAWFAVVCEFDDQLEELYDLEQPDEAHLALEWAIQEFGGAAEHSGELKDRIFGRGGSRIQTVGLLLKHRLHQLYPRADLSAIYSAIRDTFVGHQREIAFLRAPVTGGLECYLEVRCLTIAVGPILGFLALPTSFGSSHTTAPLSSQSTITSLVALTAGLQNDLIGLERDLASSENQAALNAVVVLSRSTGVPIAQAKLSIIDLHNASIQTLVDTISRESNDSLAATMAGFSTGHALWAAKSHRYKLAKEAAAGGAAKM